MILKMNFNFNFKDMLGQAGESIRRLTNGRDLNHMGKIGPRNALSCREGIAPLQFVDECNGDATTTTRISVGVKL
jgi:hypothetical protein